MKDQRIFDFTAGELIEILKQFPVDMPVLVDGYEDGYDNFDHPFVVKVVYQPENTFYNGAFQRDEQGVDVLLLQREYRGD